MPKNAWTLGKCGLKVLQYMAASLPVVSSPVGVNRDIVKHEVTGFLAESPDDWQESIERLIRNPNLRLAMGKAGQKRITKHYSTDVTFQKMILNLKDMLAES